MNPLKYYLYCKYREYFIPNSPRTYISKHYFTFNDMALYFNNISKRLNNRHPIIHFEKNNNIISLYHGNDKITFIIVENKLYLYHIHQSSVEWPYSNPPMLFDLYLNKMFCDNPNNLLKSDILFEHF